LHLVPLHLLRSQWVSSWWLWNQFRPCWSSLWCCTIPVCQCKDYNIRKIHKRWLWKTRIHERLTWFMKSISTRDAGWVKEDWLQQNAEDEQIVPLFMFVAASTKAMNRFFFGNVESAQRVSISHSRSIPLSAKVIKHSSTRRGNVKLCMLDTKFIQSTSMEKYTHLLRCGAKRKIPPPCFDFSKRGTWR
jgi:hypothetical protein